MNRLALLIGCLLGCALPAPHALAGDANGNGIEDRIELPGTQPAAVLPGPAFSLATGLAPATDCMSCHITASAAGPFPAWSGSMMGNAARDPVFWAQLDVAEADEAADSNLAGARDLCLRCHIPRGWLEGRSSAPPGPSLVNALRGMAMQADDLNGVQCGFCHRLVDRSAPDAIDANMHAGLNSNPDPELRVPPSYGNGMYILDRHDVRRGPYSPAQIGWASLVPQFLTAPADWPPAALSTHALKHSSFHRSGNLCGTCHDVSNPAATPGEPKGNTQLNFPIERTWSEWTHSIYPSLGESGSCQSCHMNGVLNAVISGGVSSQSEDITEPYRHMNDVHVHDLTGGNVWVPVMIKKMVEKFQDTKAAPNPGASPVIGATQAERDAFLNTNFAWVVKTLYPLGAYARPVGAQPPPPGFDPAAYDTTSQRAINTLQRAAQLSATRVPGGDLRVRVWNMTGHKLPTGYPEGRRMWLDVKFQAIDPANGNVTLLAQSGQYDAAAGTLYHDFNLDNAAGPKSYDVATYTDGAGNALPMGRRTQVYEARLHHTPSGTEFHFIKNNERVSDNRIPPIGWNKIQYAANKAEQVIAPAHAASQMEYHDAVSGPAAMPPVIEDTYNFDEVGYPVPAGSHVAEITLWYQSVGREYLEELVAASPRTLIYPAAGGASTFTRGDLLEYMWRTFDFGGQTRIPPVAMAKLRVALVDSDGDGLPDSWETAHGLDPLSADGNNGRNGDPDADGRSNWLEFQENTNPNVADAARVPLDLALVLDFSGSMNAPAPAGGTPKVQVLKDSVALFLKTWQQYASRNDRIAVVYFSSGIDIESGGIVDLATLPPASSVDSTIDGLIAAVNARAAGGSTALGGGLQTALKLLTTGGVGHVKHVVVFTNGMQNISPMVRKTIGGSYVIRAEPVDAASGVFGDSGVTDVGGPAFNTALNTLAIPVHTIGIGVAETPDDRWQTLLAELSATTAGLNQFISRAYDLESAFLKTLMETLRGFSPYLLADHREQLEAGLSTRELAFTLDATATKATFILSWAGGAPRERLSFDLAAPDGTVVTPLARTVEGPSYRLAYYYLPLARADGRPLPHAGAWKMIVRRRGADGPFAATREKPPAAVDFRAYLMADIADMSFDVRFSQPVYRAGDEVQVSTRIMLGQNPVRTLDKVTAQVTRPRAALGTALVGTSVATAKLEQVRMEGAEPLPDLAAAKAMLLLSDPARGAALRPVRETIELYDDGKPEHGDSLARDGVFSARVGKVSVPGLVTVEVSAAGQSAVNRRFARRFVATAVVQNAPFSASGTNLRASLERLGGDLWTVRAQATPRDVLGNYLGPGYPQRVRFAVPGAVTSAVVRDNLDGSYSQAFVIPSWAIDSTVVLAIDGQRLTEASTGFLLGSRFGLWILLLIALAALLLALALLVWTRAKARAAAAGA